MEGKWKGKWTKGSRTNGMLLAPLLMLLLPSMGYAQFYVAGEIGYASAEFSLGQPYNGIVDDNSFAYGARIGYGLHEHLAIQGSWHGYTSFDGRAAPCPPDEGCPPQVDQIPTSGTDISMWTLAAVPRITLGGGNEFEFFGTAGYYSADVRTDVGLPGQDFTRRGVVIGVGARWELAEPWNVHIEATRFGDRMTQFTVGVGWQALPFRDRQGN